MPRFKTTLRGKDVDVEMTIQSMSPIEFTLVFHNGAPESPLTREEMSFLARAAGRAAQAEQDANSKH